MQHKESAIYGHLKNDNKLGWIVKAGKTIFQVNTLCSLYQDKFVEIKVRSIKEERQEAILMDKCQQLPGIAEELKADFTGNKST